MKAKVFVLAVAFFACHKGSVDERCNPDGTCNGSNLECRYSGGGASACSVKEAPPPPRRCYYESECFCVTCADKCADAGVKNCMYSDTSVWGSKPAVCECK